MHPFQLVEFRSIENERHYDHKLYVCYVIQPSKLFTYELFSHSQNHRGTVLLCVMLYTKLQFVKQFKDLMQQYPWICRDIVTSTQIVLMIVDAYNQNKTVFTHQHNDNVLLKFQPIICLTHSTTLKKYNSVASFPFDGNCDIRIVDFIVWFQWKKFQKNSVFLNFYFNFNFIRFSPQIFSNVVWCEEIRVVKKNPPIL